MKRTLLLILIAVVTAAMNHYVSKRSDGWARDRIVKLSSDERECTGVQVIAPSGNLYVLTASHCRPILKNDTVTAEDEQGKNQILQLVEEDPNSDLLLLTPMKGMGGVAVSGKTHLHQHVHAITHGGDKPAYRSDGELLNTDETIIPLHPVDSPDTFKHCLSMPKFKVVPSVVFISPVLYCAIDTKQTGSTAPTTPGSSGGPLFDESNDLIGIASATDGTFSYWVTISDIKSFLKNK